MILQYRLWSPESTHLSRQSGNILITVSLNRIIYLNYNRSNDHILLVTNNSLTQNVYSSFVDLRLFPYRRAVSVNAINGIPTVIQQELFQFLLGRVRSKVSRIKARNRRQLIFIFKCSVF